MHLLCKRKLSLDYLETVLTCLKPVWSITEYSVTTFVINIEQKYENKTQVVTNHNFPVLVKTSCPLFPEKLSYHQIIWYETINFVLKNE